MSSAPLEQRVQAIEKLDRQYNLDQDIIAFAKQQIEDSKPCTSDMNGDD